MHRVIHNDSALDQAEAELALMEQQLQTLKEQAAIKRIAKQQLENYQPYKPIASTKSIANSPYTKNSIYIGAKVNVRGYGGIAEVVAMADSGLVSKYGNIIYLATVQFSTHRRGTHVKQYEFYAGRLTNMLDINNTANQAANQAADAQLEDCDIDQDDAEAIKQAIAQLEAQERALLNV